MKQMLAAMILYVIWVVLLLLPALTMWMYWARTVRVGASPEGYRGVSWVVDALVVICQIYAIAFFPAFLGDFAGVAPAWALGLGMLLALISLVLGKALALWPAYYVDRLLRQTTWSAEEFVGFRLRHLAFEWLPPVFMITVRRLIASLPPLEQMSVQVSPAAADSVSLILALLATGTLTILLGPVLSALLLRSRPMPEGSLQQYLQALSEWMGTPIRHVHICLNPGGRISNAWFTGWGRHRTVVMTDSLLEQLTPEEVGAVFAHEVGHARHEHLAKQWAFAICSGVLFAAGAWLLAGQMGRLLLFVIVSLYLQIAVRAWLQRRFELEADRFAARCFGPTVTASALRKIHALGAARHPAWLAWMRSHPPLEKRLAALGM